MCRTREPPPSTAAAGALAAHHDSQALPFELVALECALKEVVNAAGLQVGGGRRWQGQGWEVQ